MRILIIFYYSRKEIEDLFFMSEAHTKVIIYQFEELQFTRAQDFSTALC